MHRLKTFLFQFFFLFVTVNLYGQKNDYHWVFGHKTYVDVPGSGGSDMDFNSHPPSIFYVDRQIPFEWTNASICDDKGNLMFYSNGIVIAGKDGEVIENGTGLNPGWAADAFAEYGYPCSQGMIILPLPEIDSVFYLFHIRVVPMMTDRLFYSIVDMRLNEGKGKVIEKNQTIIADTVCYGQLSAVKHANGRDWWIVIPENSTNGYYRMLLTPNGVEGPWKQNIGPVMNFYDFSGSATFSPDGAKYVRYDITNDLNIFDFNRCTGLLSTDIHIVITDAADEHNGGGGVAISPNSRVLYVSSYTMAYQFDLQAADIEQSRIVVAEYDGFESNLPTRFYMPALAPDGRIYISSTNSVNVFHRINHPDSLGLACDFAQHSVSVPTRIVFGMPHYPNYRLGPPRWQ